MNISEISENRPLSILVKLFFLNACKWKYTHIYLQAHVS